MKVSCDPQKRAKTLRERGLDFEDAARVFERPTIDIIDDRTNYGEERYQSYGLLSGRLVMIVWTLRGETQHIISMRKCNDREKERFGRQLGS